MLFNITSNTNYRNSPSQLRIRMLLSHKMGSAQAKELTYPNGQTPLLTLKSGQFIPTHLFLAGIREFLQGVGEVFFCLVVLLEVPTVKKT